MFQHNRRLQTFIASADQKIAEANSPQDLLNIIAETDAFKGNFQFDQRDFLLYFAMDVSAFIIGLIAFQKSDESFWLFIIFLSLFIAIILLFRFFRRRSSVDKLSAAIYEKDLLFDNDLEIINSPNYSQKSLESRFHDFIRGNYSREIKTVIAGKNKQEIPFNYHYYHFHYVNETVETKTDRDGKISTQKSYDHFDRYGLIIDLSSVNKMRFNAALSIRYSKPLFGMNTGDYAPASITFRKHFIVKTDDSLQAAKFLTPTMVESIEALLQGFNEITIETNLHQELLLSFTNHDVLAGNRQYSLKEKALFFQEIKQTTELPNLRYTLHMITQMLQELDHNF